MSDALTQAQHRLLKRIDRARIGEGEGLAALVREEGLRFANLLAALLRMSRVHALDNAAFDRPVAELVGSCEKLLSLLDMVHLVAVEDQLYINDIRLRYESGSPAESLGAFLQALQLGGLDLEQPLDEGMVLGLLAALTGRYQGDIPKALMAELTARRVTGVLLVRPLRFKMRGESGPTVQALRDARGRTIDETWSALGTGKAPNTLGLRKMVLDLAESEETDFLWSEATDTPVHLLHCMRVAGLAMMLGRAVGLREGRVEDLGLAGLLHDIGYAAREEVELGQGLVEGTEGRPPPKKRHHTAGVRLLARQRGFDDAKVLRMLAILQHHDDFEGGTRPGLFGRILRICDDYDNLVRRGGGWISPAVALEHMVALTKVYDPVLLQLFVNHIGRYPPGTVLELKDGRQVRSVSFARSPITWDKPMVYVYRQADGTWPRGPRNLVDLGRTGRVMSVVERL